MDFFSFSSSNRIQALTKSIYDSLPSLNFLTDYHNEPLDKYNLENIEFSKDLNPDIWSFFLQTYEVHQELGYGQILEATINPAMIYQKSLNRAKISMLENYLNEYAKDPDIYEDSNMYSYEHIQEYGSDKGVLINRLEIDDLWEQLFPEDYDN